MENISDVNSSRRRIKVIAGIVIAAVVILGAGLYFLNHSDMNSIFKKLDSGDRYLNDLKYEEAIASFKDAINIDPQNRRAIGSIIDAYIKWADSLAEEKEYEKAIEVLKEGMEFLAERQIEVNDLVVKSASISELSKSVATDAIGNENENGSGGIVDASSGNKEDGEGTSGNGGDNSNSASGSGQGTGQGSNGDNSEEGNPEINTKASVTYRNGEPVYTQKLTGDIVPVQGLTPVWCETWVRNINGEIHYSVTLRDSDYKIVTTIDGPQDPEYLKYEYAYFTMFVAYEGSYTSFTLAGSDKEVSGNLNYHQNSELETNDGTIVDDEYYMHN